MIRSKTFLPLCAVVGTLALSGNDALGVMISFSSSSVTRNVNLTNGGVGTLQLNGLSNSIDLMPGQAQAQTVTINTGSYSVNSFGNETANTNISFNLTISGPSASPGAQSVSQPFSISSVFMPPSTPASSTATLGALLTPLTFDLGASGTLTVTPVGGTAVTTGNSATLNDSATFLLTAPVPEPVAVGLLLPTTAGLLARRRRR